jgi:subtilase family serine protease
VSSFSGALFFPPGAASAVPKVLLHTIRMPLTAFGGVNLTDIRSVQFRFNQTASGALLISDLAFADSTGGGGGQADLVETAVSNPPATVAPGGNFNVTDTAENQGTAGAVATLTRHYLSLNAIRDAGDILLTGSRAVPALGPGASSSGTVSVTVPGGTAVGTYFLLACADDTTVQAESNEGNNCIASATTVQVQAGAQPDLVVSALSNPPGAAMAGGLFSVTVTTTNQGAGAVTGSKKPKTRFYLSLDMVRDAGDKRLKGVVGVPLLAAGASHTKTRSVTIRSNTLAGTYFLIACADDTSLIAESNEANQCRTSTTTIVVSTP